MTSRHWLGIGLGIVVLAFVGWIASKTTWKPVEVEMPPKGEARSNPFYAVQRVAEQLGATTTWQHSLGSAEADAVVVASALHWTVIPSRREAIERWVDDGGRLVVDGRFLGTPDDVIQQLPSIFMQRAHEVRTVVHRNVGFVIQGLDWPNDVKIYHEAWKNAGLRQLDQLYTPESTGAGGCDEGAVAAAGSSGAGAAASGGRVMAR